MSIEVTPVSGSPKFPRAYRATKNKHVVLFTSPREGIVLSVGSAPVTVGQIGDTWVSCDDRSLWEPVNVTITHD